VLFLCTANDTSTIPGPLLDRMEVVRLSGYVLDEKVSRSPAATPDPNPNRDPNPNPNQVQIARRYLEPAARKQMGMTDAHLSLTDEAVEELIRWYLRQPLTLIHP
jgi:Lon-like ATP-dependent protease